MHYIVTDVQCVHYVDTASGGGGKLYRAVNLGSVLLLSGKSVAVLYDSLPLLWLGLVRLVALIIPGGRKRARALQAKVHCRPPALLPGAAAAPQSQHFPSRAV